MANSCGGIWETFSQFILLSTLQEELSYEELMVVKPGNRLLVMPV
ncbi:MULTISPECIES: hypothetical protein [unclassified Tolypothrix]|nr:MULTISPECIES: hypothetical protein [unclassified Tolypothrix]EKF03256.1 hypothetical protein FDUTEX481_02714 [Tolypothrix sp. PCC 7601]